LNTDYKIYTKTIAQRPANIAPMIIHKDQAGFIPKRSLYDHTRTTQMVVEYCEITENNGCIVALDQGKAYNKIDHEYLWIILLVHLFHTGQLGNKTVIEKDT
jgi:acyl-[acyl carrier protein]--UDP-N-acetylglucosamine O-acyltransferase